jgi:hypothetical protein
MPAARAKQYHHFEKRPRAALTNLSHHIPCRGTYANSAPVTFDSTKVVVMAPKLADAAGL